MRHTPPGNISYSGWPLERWRFAESGGDGLRCACRRSGLVYAPLGQEDGPAVGTLRTLGSASMLAWY